MSTPSFVSLVQPPPGAIEMACYFVFSGSHLLVCETEQGVEIPFGQQLETLLPTVSEASLRELYLGYIEGEERKYRRRVKNNRLKKETSKDHREM